MLRNPFDAPGKGFLDLDSQNSNTITYETISNRKVYQVFAGNNWEELIKNWTSISGRTQKILYGPWGILQSIWLSFSKRS